MTAPPTREEIAEILSDIYGRLPDRSLYPSVYRMADALLARLRPAWGSPTQQAGDEARGSRDVWKEQAHQFAARISVLESALARKDEALRACVEALAKIIAASKARSWSDFNAAIRIDAKAALAHAQEAGR